MAKRLLIDALHPEETRVVVAGDNQIIDFDFVSSSKKQLKGNIYLAKITRVEPSLQAAFVEYGGGKQGFLPFSEIHPDYYQIPVSDRKRLLEEAQRESEENEGGTPASQESQETMEDRASQEMLENAAPSEDGQMDGAASALPLAPAIDTLPDLPEYAPQDEPVLPIEQPPYMAETLGFPSSQQDIPLPEEINLMTEASSDASPEMNHEKMSGETAGGSQNENTGEPPSEIVETLQNDEEEIESRPKKFFSRRYKIQEVIRRGQVVLVQVIKEERGNKGASLTTYLSLAGRYCVLMPNSPKDGGISRKIASSDDRKRLKAISTELRLAAGMSVIIRTAGTDRTRAEIKRDYDYLVKVWNRVREETLKSNAPALIYEESDVIKRAIRDQYTNDMDEIVVEGEEGYKAAHDFMKLLLPSHSPKIKLYDGSTPLFYAYNIEEQLLSMHDPVVKLRSGGYIVINPTEALISIDVNSGRATGERNIEETASKTNLEAAVEVARQLRLRDLAGLIVIDFIDMLESRNRRAVEKALKDALKLDRAKIQLGRISPFGLLEMSRQRLRPSIAETNMIQCPHCIGRGLIRSNESMSIQLIRALEKEASSGQWSSLRLIAPQTVALHLLNTKREALQTIEQRHNTSIQVLIDTDLAESDFNLEKMRRANNERVPAGNDYRRGRRPERPQRDEQKPAIAQSVLEEMNSETVLIESGEETESEISSENRSALGDSSRENRDRNRSRSRRGRRGPRRNYNGRPSESDRPDAIVSDLASNDNISESPDEAIDVMPIDGADATQQGRPFPRRERGNRGRKRWRDRDDRKGGTDSSSHVSADIAAEQPRELLNTTLPAFTRQEPVLLEPPPPLFHDRNPPPATVQPAVESTPRDPNKPIKKGWWQKMIDLD